MSAYGGSGGGLCLEIERAEVQLDHVSGRCQDLPRAPLTGWVERREAGRREHAARRCQEAAARV